MKRVIFLMSSLCALASAPLSATTIIFPSNLPPGAVVLPIDPALINPNAAFCFVVDYLFIPAPPSIVVLRLQCVSGEAQAAAAGVLAQSTQVAYASMNNSIGVLEANYVPAGQNGPLGLGETPSIIGSGAYTVQISAAEGACQ